MQLNSNTVQLAHQIYEEGKFWAGAVGALWSVFNLVQWVKSIKENDLHHLQLGVDDVKSGLREQTAAIVGELTELRQDIRTLYLTQK